MTTVEAGRHSFREDMVHRDDDGQFAPKSGGGSRHSAPDSGPAGGNAPEPAKGADKLRLHGKIQLGDGEHLTGSSRIDADTANIDLAATNSPDGPRITLALHDYDEKWGTGDPDEDDNTDSATEPSGLDDARSVRLDPAQANELADTLDVAQGALKKAKSDQDALWRDIDKLERNDLATHAERVRIAQEKLAEAESNYANPNPNGMGPQQWKLRVDRARQELAALDKQNPKGLTAEDSERLAELRRRADAWNGRVLLDGSISGSRGQITYRAHVEDDTELLDVSIGGTRVSLDASGVRSLAKHLRRVGETAGIGMGGDVKASRRQTIAAAEQPKLARRDGVELIHAGAWNISSGTWDASAADLTHAVAALECPAIRPPVLKLGHVDPRFDGQPAVGRVENLRLADQGRTLLGDYVGHPVWLDKVMASAYPDRSVEGAYNHRCQIGHTHPFVLTAVALLGVTAPGVGTLGRLEDIAAMYGVEAAASGEPNGTPVAATVEASKSHDDDPKEIAEWLVAIAADGRFEIRDEWRSKIESR